MNLKSVKTWWLGWGDSVKTIGSSLVSAATVVELLRTYLPSGAYPPKTWFLLILGGVCFVALLCFELSARGNRHVYKHDDTKGIKSYMHDWIGKGGRVAIWTRDMSWANSADTMRLLRDKATKKELILCLPKHTAASTELLAAGAEVCEYGVNFLEAPASRFTIVSFGRDGARVAIGRQDGDAHVIDEFHAGDHPAYYLAEDLISIVRQQTASSRP